MLVLVLSRVSLRVSNPFVSEGVQASKFEGSLARNAGFEASRCVVSSFWLSSGFAVSMQKAAETYLFHTVTRSRGFPLPSQCLWGKLEKLFFSKVS